MKLMVLVAAAIAVSPQTYVVHVQTPRGENVSATARLAAGGDATITLEGRAPVRVSLKPGSRPDRSVGPVIDSLNSSNAVAQAALHGKSTAQIMVGPQRTCVDLALTTNGNTVTATGTVAMPPPPPDRGDGQRQQPPPPQRNDRGPGEPRMNVRIVVTLSGQELASARGDIGPANGGPGPHFTWSLTSKGE